jgi:hypothetical protein
MSTVSKTKVYISSPLFCLTKDVLTKATVEVSFSSSGSGPIRPFNIASGPGGNRDGFIADFTAQFHPNTGRFLVILQLRAISGFLSHQTRQ